MSRAELYRMVSAAMNRRRPHPPGQAYETWSTIVHELCSTFTSSNTKFDPERFLKDCGAL